MKKKEEVLVVFGMNPNTTNQINKDGSVNRWFISSSPEIVQKIQAKINLGLFDKVVFVDSDPSIFVFKETAKMNIKVFGNKLLSVENEITIRDYDENSLIFNGDQFDHILPSDKTNITVSGIDLVGLLSNSVVELNACNYHITFNPTLVKSYKDVTYSRIKGFCKIEK
jgi:hypothetical protein